MLRQTHFHTTPLAFACLTVLSVPASLAQTGPDAGQVLREQTQPTLEAPRTSTGLRLLAPAFEPTLPGGVKVVIQSVRVQGNSVLSESALRTHLGEVAGKSFDLAGLRGLAEQLASAYYAAGYPFARAYLPQQDLSSGQLTIEVIEGRYGEVKAAGDVALAPQAQAFLSRLKAGDPIESGSLERATLILDDQPGIRTAPVMRPGLDFGSGDLEVEVQRTQKVRGDAAYDNHGNRYTGEYRVRVNLWWDSPFTLGDQVQVSSLYAGENLWLGSLGYNIPLGNNGLRGNVSYAHTRYELGREFAAAQVSGTARVSTLGASYPLVRSQVVNLTASVSLQHKALHDQKEAGATTADKRSDVWPLSLQFDKRDALAGGGLTFGSLVFTQGRLKLDEELSTDDALNTRGGFHKWNLDVARIQATSVQGLTLFGRLSGQSTNKNLDSSEKFGLGGASGVRAYPVGEGYGDEGWLSQVELRYVMGEFTPYLFHDAGAVRLNARPQDRAQNKRSIGGVGAGARYQRGAWNADLTVAWSTGGGQAQDANSRQSPRVWLVAGCRF